MLDGLKAVSFDVYQTLADLDEGFEGVLDEVLSGVGTGDRLIDKWVLWGRLGGHVRDVLGEHSKDGIFRNVRSIFTEAYRRTFTEYSLDMDPNAAAGVFADFHGRVAFFSDTLPVLTAIDGRLPIFITSDADDDFLGEVIRRLPIVPAGVVSSEAERSYKGDPDGRIWKRLITLAGCHPSAIVHIGDGVHDIEGAKRAGIHAIWLNRGDGVWTGEVKPDMTVTSLYGLLDLIGLPNLP